MTRNEHRAFVRLLYKLTPAQLLRQYPDLMALADGDRYLVNRIHARWRAIIKRGFKP